MIHVAGVAEIQAQVEEIHMAVNMIVGVEIGTALLDENSVHRRRGWEESGMQIVRILKNMHVDNI